MKPLKGLKCNLLLICFFVFFATYTIGEVDASTFYASNSGSGKTCSNKIPCTPNYAINTMSSPGDTVILKDGTYTGSSYMIAVTNSGSVGAPIIIRAENDGNVIIDGRGSNPTFLIDLSSRIHDITVEGITFQNSSKHVVKVNYADRITFKRVSAYNAGFSSTSDYHIFSVAYSTHVLLEDTSTAGFARFLYNIISDNNIIIRRCYGVKDVIYNGNNANVQGFMQIYNTSNSIVENCIARKLPNTGHNQGLMLWHSSNSAYPMDNNELYGNVVYDFDSSIGFKIQSKIYNVTGNRYLNNVSINNKWGFSQAADDDLIVDKLTVVGATGYAFGVQAYNYEPKDPAFAMNGVLKNSVLMSSDTGLSLNETTYLEKFTNEYYIYSNKKGSDPLTYNFKKMATQGTGERIDQPNYDISNFGKGAYLIALAEYKVQGEGGSDIGAEVLYRYHDRKLTNVPLWPWPMENRICAETGYSVTYENGCTKGGGLWRTIDGVYSGQSQSADGIDNDQDGSIDIVTDGGESGSDINDTNSSTSSNKYKYIINVDTEGTYIDAEHFTNTISPMGISAFLPENDLIDYFGTGYLTTSGSDVNTCSDVKEGKEFVVNFIDTGSYNVWIRGYAPDSSSDSVFIGLNGVCVGYLYSNGNWNNWDWMNNGSGNTINITETGIHELNIWLREPNFHVDGIYLTKGTETPPDDFAYLDSIPPAPPVGLVIE
ncbi:MAG: hypothetical protein JSW20_14370 [Nitrospiraceae bacterium]|nr:MAG: hypothetical protein JSW20_14370 [Nitrospiraceae bacterium]